MINGIGMSKCFKISSREENIKTIKGDVIYVRNHPKVYLNIGDKKYKSFIKVYMNRTDPKYNMDKLHSLVEPYIFKIENSENLEGVPAKPGDLIYRSGDSFVYMKEDIGGMIDYLKILKVN